MSELSYEQCRESFRLALLQAVDQYQAAGNRIRWRDRRRVRVVARRSYLLEDLEEDVCGMLYSAGVLSWASIDAGTGLLVGDWTDFIQQLIDRLPEILEFIAGLVSLFLLFL